MYRQESGTGVGAVVHQAADSDLARAKPDKLWIGLIALIGGIALTMAGARLMVGSSIALAEIAGLSETVIGLTIVAIGTSLPELVTSVVAAFRREADIALGNVIGSNVFNVLGILGVTVLVQPLTVPAEMLGLDVWVMLAATVVLVIFAVSAWRISRWEGALLLGAYGAYVGYLVAVAG
jgi:cation:H+ antiporter